MLLERESLAQFASEFVASDRDTQTIAERVANEQAKTLAELREAEESALWARSVQRKAQQELETAVVAQQQRAENDVILMTKYDAEEQRQAELATAVSQIGEEAIPPILARLPSSKAALAKATAGSSGQ